MRDKTSRRKTRERTNLLNDLVGFGKLLAQASWEQETIKEEVRFLGRRILETRRGERLQREDRNRFMRRRTELLLRGKTLAAQVVKIKSELTRTKRRLEV